MSTEADRLATVKDNYDQAANNQAMDLAGAQDAVQVSAVQANVAAARLAYYTAVADALSKSGPDVEQAYTDATNALNQVKQARSAAEKIPTLLGKLTKATDKANTLVQKAKSALG